MYNSNNASLQQLPPELLRKIANKLPEDNRDKKALSLTCKHLHKVIPEYKLETDIRFHSIEEVKNFLNSTNINSDVNISPYTHRNRFYYYDQNKGTFPYVETLLIHIDTDFRNYDNPHPRNRNNPDLLHYNFPLSLLQQMVDRFPNLKNLQVKLYKRRHEDDHREDYFDCHLTLSLPKVKSVWLNLYKNAESFTLLDAQELEKLMISSSNIFRNNAQITLPDMPKLICLSISKGCKIKHIPEQVRERIKNGKIIVYGLSSDYTAEELSQLPEELPKKNSTNYVYLGLAVVGVLIGVSGLLFSILKEDLPEKIQIPLFFTSCVILGASLGAGIGCLLLHLISDHTPPPPSSGFGSPHVVMRELQLA